MVLPIIVDNVGDVLQATGDRYTLYEVAPNAAVQVIYGEFALCIVIDFCIICADTNPIKHI